MSINVTAKSKVYISDSAFNANPILTDYTGQTWVEIGEITSLGSFGAKGKEVVASVLDDAYIRRLKGSIDSGTVELVVLRDPFDVGQIAARAASQAYDTFLFKVELNDAITNTGTNSIFYFRASVMGSESRYGTADDLIETTFALGITGQILEVPAAVTIVFSPVAGALPGATSGTPYTETISATGGLGTVTYAVTTGSLPAGLTLNSASGVISGTTTATGSHSFSITATFGGAGADDAAYTLLVS
jgi:hypothetical protein